MRAARVVLLASIALAACGRLKPATPPTGAAGTTGSAGSTGAAGTMGTSANACGDYCALMKSVCKGPSAQYYDDANCMKVCARLPPGTAADTTGNTVGCRANKATEAAFEAGAVKPSCWAAGPLGFGACGSECDIFCAVALSYCSAAEGYTGTPPFASLDDCHAQCAKWKRQLDFSMPGSYGPAYSPGLTAETTDTLDCRASHLLVNAFKDKAAQQMHCPHAANKSEVCGPGNAAPASSDGGTGDALDGGTGDARDGGDAPTQ